MGKGIRLKDLAGVISTRFQPVCLSISEDERDKNERLYYNEDCYFAGRKRCFRKNFIELIKEYGDYWVWDISLFTHDCGSPYIEVSAMKYRTE